MAADLTQLLGRVAGGDQDAKAELVEQVYNRLRAIAAVQGGRAGTLQPTALVHEAYLKLFGSDDVSFEGRNHFFGAAARAMRQAAVEHARRKHADKRGGGGDWSRVTLSGLDADISERDVDVADLDEAIRELTELNPRQATIVEMRFFGGLGVDEVAQLVGVSPRTVELDWRTARAWLRSRLSGPSASGGAQP